MAYVVRELLTSVPSEDQEKSLLSSLTSRYTPLLSSAFEQTCHLLGLPTTTKNETALGEVFISGDERFFYYKKLPAGTEVGSIGKKDIQEDHDSFVQHILSFLGTPTERKSLKLTNSTFSALRYDYPELHVTDKDREVANFFSSNGSARKFLLELLQTERLNLTTYANHLAPGVLESLETMKLVQSEFLIFCRQTGSQIMMVESTEAIEQASKQGFKCFNCGRSFRDEQLNQFVMATPYGKQMSELNRWLAIRLYDILLQHFLPENICLILEQETGNLLVTLGNSLFMVEVKETPYKLKNAYLLVNKMALYKPAATFLLTLPPLSPEVSRYLEKEREKHHLYFGDSLASFEEKLPLLTQKASTEYIGEVLRSFTVDSSISLGKLVLIGSHKLLDFEPDTSSQPAGQSAVHSEKALPSMEGIKPEVSQRVSAPTSNKNVLVNKIIGELTHGVSGREGTLHVLLQDLNNTDRRWKGFISSEEGFVIASTLSEDLSEMLASYGSECFLIAEKILGNYDITSIAMLTLASKNFILELYPIAGLYLALSTSIETVLLEPSTETEDSQVAKSVCEQLLLKEEVQAASFLNHEGLPLYEATKNSDLNLPFPIFIELFQQLSPPFGLMNQGDLESCAVRTPTFNVSLTRTNSGYLGVATKKNQSWEELLPPILSLSSTLV